jgi:hypothetical protein
LKLSFMPRSSITISRQKVSRPSPSPPHPS